MASPNILNLEAVVYLFLLSRIQVFVSVPGGETLAAAGYFLVILEHHATERRMPPCPLDIATLNKISDIRGNLVMIT